MSSNVRIVTPYPPRKGGLGTFSRSTAQGLMTLTAEVGAVRVAAIDNDGQHYWPPVDIVIEQYRPSSWVDATQDIMRRANEMKANPTLVLMQHEYGLDPDEDGNDCKGNNYVSMAEDLKSSRAFRTGHINVLVYTHTILAKPDDHQRNTLQNLAEKTDGLLVPADKGIDILVGEEYGIDSTKILQMHHGIRMHNTSLYDRLLIKEQLGLENIFLVTTLGLVGTDKGVPYGIKGYAEFINSSVTNEERSKFLYLIGGQFHPKFMKEAGGRPYRKCKRSIDAALSESGLNVVEVKSKAEFDELDFKKLDIVWLNTFLDEDFLIKLYAATNVMVLPYLNQQQICSGILADTLGSGRVAIASKSLYANEMLYSSLLSIYKKGTIGIGDPHARGGLVDPKHPEQIAEFLHYIAEHEEDRLAMEDRAGSVGYKMAWPTIARQIVHHADHVRNLKLTPKGRGVRYSLIQDSHLAIEVQDKLNARKKDK